MNKYICLDEWSIIENNFNPGKKRILESIMSQGNSYMGIRGNFEENYSSDSLAGSYLAGVYYPDKNRVGWWKIGYPNYYARIVNIANFIGINIKIDGEELDLAKIKLKKYKRILNMQNGLLKRNFTIETKYNKIVEISTERFLSMSEKELAVIKYKINTQKNDIKLEIIPYIDGNVINTESYTKESYWDEIEKDIEKYQGYLHMKTKYTDFQVSTAMKYSSNIEADKLIINKEKKYIDNKLIFKVKKNKSLIITKYISVLRKKNYKDKNLNKEALRKVNYAYQRGFNSLLQDNNNTWQDIWQICDIKIDGDVAAQQGIRFNIFQLYQSYTGFDPELNISPKGLSGEKYGGTTYWDTEAFCLPFYLLIGEKNVARNLLLYRYKHLEKARENASKLGLKGALYPMVTINGEECHNEWEITFEEIHRNAAIAYAIYDYVKYTEDKKYLLEYGFKVLLEIARFWADRVQYQSAKDKYMILGVTGPNEYENNVNNNWYTNRMVSWTLEYTLKVNKYIKKHYPLYHSKIFNKINIQVSELNKWQEIKEKMYYPMIKEPDLFAQQDGFTDKKIISTDSLSDKELPLHKNWSWDKILRSPYIKQADVLQGLYFLGDKYSKETKRKNFDYYEKLTVHESSLSPSIHSIIASEIACYHKAYKYYLQSARLDLENYNKDTEDGLHITSMGGSWLAITKGFAGMKTKDNILSFSPYLPDNWKSYSFKIKFRKRLLLISINTSTIIINLKKGKKLNINIYNQIYLLKNKIEININ